MGGKGPEKQTVKALGLCKAAADTFPPTHRHTQWVKEESVLGPDPEALSSYSRATVAGNVTFCGLAGTILCLVRVSGKLRLAHLIRTDLFTHDALHE